MLGRTGRIALSCVLLATAVARATPILDALHAHDWPAAELLAAQSPDPVATRLVTFARLLTPGAATDAEIAGFIAGFPDWPDQPLLTRRLADAIAADPDDGRVLALCRAHLPATAPARLRCADAAHGAHDDTLAANAARAAWVDAIDDPAGEQSFLRQWAATITPEDDWRRFDRLEWAHDPAADRAAARLDPGHAAEAHARLAFRHRDPGALSALAMVPAPLRGDPTLLIEEAVSLRATDDDAAALALWRAAGAAAETTAPDGRRPAFWAERDRLARRRLAAGDAQGGYFLADDGHAPAENQADAQFLAGWIALRRLGDPARATAHFEALDKLSHALITQARAQYWLSRAAAAGGHADQAAARLAQAGAWPNTYYGQLAAPGAAARMNSLSDPAWTAAQALSFTGGELVRAATILAGWGERGHARAFLLRAAGHVSDDAGLAVAAHVATSLGMPDVAVQIARLAGRAGVLLPQTGWPTPYDPPEGCDRALTLGLMRQESSFDADATSAAGARGLMQMMPRTAHDLAAARGDPPDGVPLADPDTNMALGCAYLSSLLAQFRGVRPFAVAAYNAGPRHVREWLAANGDPSPAGSASDDMIDWIEMIPFAETRNYVERVLENTAIYEARLR